MNVIEAYRKYRANGFACHPTKVDKTPLIPTNWKQGFSEDAFVNAVGIGVICGKISGGLECLDFDNHFGDAKNILTEYISIPEVQAIFKKHKLPIEMSMRGGFHLMFRCSVNEGNRKLAQRKNKQGKPEAIIETRGEGGYFCAYPSSGYTIKKNDIFTIATISPIERATLIDAACSFNEYSQPAYRSEYETGDRPGDIYNRDDQSVRDVEGLLLSNGWKKIDNYKWRRPGKDEGVSATLGKVASNVFYCFTSNAHPFEPNTAYSPFQVLSLLKYNGDFKEAAKSIAPVSVTLPAQPKTGKISQSEMDRILENARIDTSKPIEKPPVIISIKEQSGTQTITKRLCTLGNFSCIKGKAKSRKTFLISLITAAVLNDESVDKFVADLPTGKDGIMYFDTEQSDYDCANVISRIERMSGRRLLKSFALREYSPLDRCDIIEYAFKKWGNETALCVIDGIADCAVAINEEDEATRVSSMLLRLTKTYNCHITTVIHENKNDNFATGHLGSSIMKKAEAIITVTKVKEIPNMSDVNCDMSRGIEFEPFSFVISADGIPKIEGTPKPTSYPTKLQPDFMKSPKIPYREVVSIPLNTSFDTPIADDPF